MRHGSFDLQPNENHFRFLVEKMLRLFPIIICVLIYVIWFSFSSGIFHFIRCDDTMKADDRKKAKGIRTARCERAEKKVTSWLKWLVYSFHYLVNASVHSESGLGRINPSFRWRSLFSFFFSLSLCMCMTDLDSISIGGSPMELICITFQEWISQTNFPFLNRSKVSQPMSNGPCNKKQNRWNRFFL